MTRRLTDKSIAALTVAKRTTIADPKLAGHYVRVTPKGAKTFVAVARDPPGKQVWHTIGSCDLLHARPSSRAGTRCHEDHQARCRPGWPAEL